MYGLGMGDTLGIIATMPPLPASACTSAQTYIPPGGNMGPQYGNSITPTGACIDNNVGPSSGGATCFKLFGNMESCIGPVGSLTLFAGLGILGILLLVGGKR